MPVRILVGDLKRGNKVSFFGEVYTVQKVTPIMSTKQYSVKLVDHAKPLIFNSDQFIELAR